MSPETIEDIQHEPLWILFYALVHVPKSLDNRWCNLFPGLSCHICGPGHNNI